MITDQTKLTHNRKIGKIGTDSKVGLGPLKSANQYLDCLLESRYPSGESR